ncbi:hypothetical protein [Lactobacillus hominis]|uniref:hypothetical protein n=1 Tax=Lactobacillus hominis TaxID=1203033 RepID=UPI0023F1C464|nr:hypothetical protein [Lactobacillus hominis]
MKIKSWMLMLDSFGIIPLAMVYILEIKCEQIVTILFKKIKLSKIWLNKYF